MRIVLCTFGSFGDLHPYLAVGRALQARGHHAVLATHGFYREKVQALGLGFHPVRPDRPDTDADTGIMRRMMEPRRGTERIIRELFMPVLRGTYDDLLEACVDADALVSHPLAHPAPLVAAKLPGLRWASSHLAPIGFLSAHDPPVLPPAPWLERLRPLGPGFHRGLFRVVKTAVRPWMRPLDRLRTDLGLPRGVGHPLFEGAHAPALVLAMFSRELAAPAPDWPCQTRVTGFPFYDRAEDHAAGLPPELARFLDAGPPPIVFTLGTSAVHAAGDFFVQSAAAAARLGCRAVLLLGREVRDRPVIAPCPTLLPVDYAPFSALFPRAAAVVHQGGVGTTGQAMRAGVPQLIVPFAHDQHDNAARVVRRGLGRTVSRPRYLAGGVAAELSRLAGNPGYSRRAAEVGARVRAEDGAAAAGDAIEELLDPSRPEEVTIGRGRG